VDVELFHPEGLSEGQILLSYKQR